MEQPGKYEVEPKIEQKQIDRTGRSRKIALLLASGLAWCWSQESPMGFGGLVSSDRSAH